MTALVLTAHGSADPRSSATTHAVAERIRAQQPGLEVVPAFCEQTSPNLRDVLAGLGERAIITPMLLANAYHARVDIPAMVRASGFRVRRAPVLGEDPALVQVLRERLAQAGASPDDRELGVIVVAVGSTNAAANARTSLVAPAVSAGTRWAGCRIAFATGPHPTVAESLLRLRSAGARRLIIAPWFLAHGRITDRVAEYAAVQRIRIAEPLGSHDLVAATLLDRYQTAAAGSIAA